MSPSDLVRWLFDPAPGPPRLVYLAPIALFLAVLLGSLLVIVLRKALFPGNSLQIRLAQRFGAYGTGLGVVGLILLGARYLGLSFLEMRLFLALAVVGVGALAAYVVWYIRSRYPAEAFAYERAKERDRFVRPGSHAARRRARKQRR